MSPKQRELSERTLTFANGEVSAPLHPWVAQIEPALFDAYLAAHPEPFSLEDLRVLIPGAP